MADQQGWWRIEFTPDDIELSDADRAHIGNLITIGCTQGQILPDDDSSGDVPEGQGTG
jgi:hypothetical protein